MVDQLVFEFEDQTKQIMMIPVKFAKVPSLYPGSQTNHWKNRWSRNLADNSQERKEELCLLFD